MVLGFALAVLGVAELLAPKRVVDFGFGVAVADPDAAAVRPWVYTAARLEGLLILLWVARRSRRRNG